MIEWITQLDHQVLVFIQENLRFDGLTDALISITHLGDHGQVWIILCLVLLLFKRTRKAGMCGLLALLINLLITNVTLKPLVARVRPYEQFEDLVRLIGRQKDFSFPSGHTSSSFAAAWAIFMMDRPIKKISGATEKTSASLLGMTSMVLAIAIAYSRLYVGVHFPTDVLAGAAIGIFSAWAAGKLVLYVIAKLKLESIFGMKREVMERSKAEEEADE